jgi:hemoglobin-like flavoprotein
MNDSVTSNEPNWQAVRRTLEMVLPLADTFAFMFYNRFFEQEPAARPLFKNDMSEQRQKIIKLLTFALRDLEQPRVIEAELRRLGQRHAPYQISRQQYEHMNEAIIWAFVKILGDKFTEEMCQAWRQALNAITDIMLTAADEMEATPTV